MFILDAQPLPYPEELYYAETKTGASYTATPTGNPDVNRAIRNEAACFINISTTIEKKPKKIIFSDWTYSNWDAQKKAALPHCFDDLMRQGFEIYFWQSGELIRYTKDNWDPLKATCPPLDDPKIIRVAAIKQKKQFTEDNLFLLDDYWVDRLLNPNNTQIRRKLKLSNVATLNNKVRQKLLTFTKKLRPKVEEIIVDEFSVNAAQVLSLLKENLPDCRLTSAIEKMKVSLPLFSDKYQVLMPFIEEGHPHPIKRIKIQDSANMSIANLLTLLRQAHLIEDLDLEGCTTIGADITSLQEWIQIEELRHLTRLDLSSSNISPETLLALVQKTPNIEKLIISDIAQIETHSFELLCNARLPKLRQLIAESLNIRAESVTRFIESHAHIESLDLNRNKDIAGCFNTLHSNTLLAQLKQVYVSNTNLIAADVTTLLEKAPNLKSLDLMECKDIAGGFSNLSAAVLLPALKRLQASRSKISSEDIKTLLEKAPNLESLYLSSCNLGQSLAQLPLHPALTALTNIYLTSSDIDVKTLLILLKKAPNLEGLYLSKCNIGGIAEFFPNLQLPTLRKIDVSSSNIRGEDLKILLEKAAGLEELDFSNCQNIGGFTALDPRNTLPALKKIVASKSNIQAADLQALLQQANRLETLNLDYCQILSDDYSWLPSDTTLTELKSLSLARSNLSIEKLIALLHITPQLETLEIHHCMNLNGEPGAALLNTLLPKLRNINAYSSNISMEVLRTFLIQAPNLEALHLSDCANIGGSFVMLPPNTILPFLKTVTLYDSNISAEDITILLEKAPNIEELDIHNCFDMNAFIDKLNPNLKLLRLTQLNLPNSELRFLDENRLAKLRNMAPNLLCWDMPDKPSREAGEEEKEHKGSNDPFSLKRNANIRKPVDADTKFNPNKKFNLTRIFYSTAPTEHPEISHYRLEAYDAVQLNPNFCQESQAFELYHQNSDLQLINRMPQRLSNHEFQQKKSIPTHMPNHDLIYGRQKLHLDGQWQAIASLSAAEDMLACHTTPIDADIELQYSKRDNLYYIRSKKGNEDINFEFLLKVPRQKPSLPPKIQAIVDYFLQYESGKLRLDAPNQSSGKEYLKAILKDRKGACRHRAVAFKAEMKKHFPDLASRIINNDCHAFVEVYVKEQWIRCDLGGYPATLEITETLTEGNGQVKRESLNSRGALLPLGTSHFFNKYDAIMETWSHEKTPSVALKTFRHSLLKPSRDIKKTLVALSSDEAVNAMLLSVQQQCLRIKRPVFYVNSASDVVCKADFLKKEGNVGTIAEGPGGALHDFLTAKYSKDNPPVLLINYANFSPSEIVGLNALLDKERRADGIAVPRDAMIIGAINSEAPDVYEGSDFYSRFDKRYSQPISETLLHDFLNQHAISEKKAEERTYAINLYHAPDWKSQLLGRWIMTQDGFRFEEGALKTAIATGRTIEIKNGLWEDPEFIFFWQQALQLGHICHNGETLSTKWIHLVKSRGYDWDLLKKSCSITPAAKSRDAVLNPSNLGEFFATYHFQKTNNCLVKGEGLIEKARKEGKKTLCIQLTRSISEDDWARLLKECHTHRIALEIKALPGVVLPGTLSNLSFVPMSLPLTKPNPRVQIIQSADPDATINALTAEDPKRIVIDVSECKPSDLLIETRPHYNKKKLKLEFFQQKRALLKALEKGQHIILTGTISNELADALAPLLLEMQDNPKAGGGKLSIVVKDIHNLRYASCISEHLINTAHQETASLQRARAHFPDSWRGLSQLEYDPNCLGHFNPNTSHKETRDFNAYRNQLLFEVLNRSPYVFIAGLSGVGKSTFIEKEFMQGIRHKLYHGENSLEKWALDKSDCPKFLFIDEANLSPRQWTEMEGLFHNKPPTMLINGELRTLSTQHKIIFAGNPVNYGDERKLASFFERHGRAVVFDPLPLAVIFEQILKPVFENTSLSTEATNLCEPIFNIYAFLCAQSTTEVLISPRELQMMALLTLSYCRERPDISPNTVARHYAYTLAKSLVPADKESLFEQQFGKEAPSIPALLLPVDAINQQGSGFTVTPSRLPALSRLHELLVLRDLRVLASNDAQKFGGLGGVILEGDSSVGKSAMVLAMLRAHGFQEVHDLKQPAHPEKPFYRMDVSSSTDDKEKLLIKAFYEGAVVVIDEINSSPMMERLLNDLLMGKLPDKYKIPHKTIKAGFMILGTQNPVTLAGRRTRSTALSRRLCFLELPLYPREELLQIIVRKERYSKAALDEFELIVDSFMRKSAEARQHGYTPAPTLRQVLQEADRIKIRYPALKNAFKIPLPISRCKTLPANLGKLVRALFFKTAQTSKEACAEGLMGRPHPQALLMT